MASLRRPRARWHLLYYLLVAFDVCTVLISLGISHRLRELYSDAVQTNQVWARRLASYSELGDLATDVNAPGNDVFDSLDHAGESERHREALQVFVERLIVLQRDLDEEASAAHRSAVTPELESVGASMLAMVDEAELIFSYFAADDPDSAGRRMATMDRRFAEVNRALGRLRERVSEIQAGYFAEQEITAASIATLEYMIAGLVLIMILCATVYGHNVARQVERTSLLTERTEMLAVERRALEQSDRRFRTLAQNSSDAIFTLDRDGRIHQDSIASSSYWLPALALAGSFVDLLVPADRTAAERVLKRSLHQPRTNFTLQAGVLSDQSTPLTCELVVNNLLDVPEVGGIVVTCRDVSEREALRAQISKLEAHRELEKITRDFVSTASHEFRTPLTAISGFSELLLAQPLPSPKHHAWVQTIHRETQRLSHLVEELLDLSRIEEGRIELRREAVSLSELVLRSAAGVSGITSTHRILPVLPPDLPLLEADPEKLMQILTNLLSNAVKYSPEGGEIIVSARRQGDLAQVTVSDQGLGMSEEELATLFGRFTRIGAHADRGIKGSGLGLYITRQLVELHGGSIWAESDGPGLGSRFRFTCPLASPASLTSPVSAAARGSII